MGYFGGGGGKMRKREINPEEEEEQKEEEESKDNYFLSPKKANLTFIHSGSHLLDCVLGGGWPLGRISNVVGDRSTGKTQIAIEACVNFANLFPTGHIKYHEAEAAFDEGYAETLGMPLDRVEFIQDAATVEELFEALTEEIGLASKDPILYIVDSLDALSDKAEMDRGISEGTFGTQKPKQLSQMFRRLTKKIQKTRMHLMIVSQIRDKIGVTFGARHSRAGGKALDFYASQIIWLTELSKIKKVKNKIERIIGINIRAKCNKNKIGPPFRETEFPIIFSYGIDDFASCLLWLDSVGELKELDLVKKDIPELLEILKRGEEPEIATLIKEMTIKKWYEIEATFMPKNKKY